jgi:hypothetical protein
MGPDEQAAADRQVPSDSIGDLQQHTLAHSDGAPQLRPVALPAAGIDRQTPVPSQVLTPMSHGDPGARGG